MRIIAGKYRSRPLSAPPGRHTRPTSDRLRETLFNVLAPRIAGSIFLDLYAGSGAVGIEALSRGAAEAIFVEHAAPALKTIRANLSLLKIHSGYALESATAAAALKRLATQGREVNLVFLDPPYEAAEEYELILNLLGGASSAILAADAIVIAEHAKRHKLAETYGTLHQYRTLHQGDASLSFYRAE
jgi:16S rRNA (guanine(966)-N(2))-methyltransferase RsmD